MHAWYKSLLYQLIVNIRRPLKTARYRLSILLASASHRLIRIGKKTTKKLLSKILICKPLAHLRRQRKTVIQNSRHCCFNNLIRPRLPVYQPAMLSPHPIF